MHEEFLACSEEHPADIPQADLDEMNKMLRDAHERDDEQSEQERNSQVLSEENVQDYYITNADENKSDKPIQQFENLPDNNSVEGNKTDAPIQGTLDSNIGTSRNKRKKKDEISDEEYQQLTANDIAESKRRLSELPSVDRRGLNDETFQHLGFGFLPNWKHPKCQNSIPTPRFIARLGNTNDPPAYNAIMTPSGRERFKNSKLWEADKCLTAVAKLVFHPSALTASLVAITEGEIDAASIWQCLKRGKIIDAGTCSGVDVCALGGTDAGVTDLIKRLETMDRKPLIVILFDGDDTGRTDKLKPGRERAEELRKQLWAIGVVAVCEFFEDVLSDDEKKEVGDKPDANQILQAKGDDYLYWRFARIVKKARDDFKQAEEEMKRWREHEQEQSSRNAGDDIQPSTQNNQSEKKASYDPEIQKLIDEINDTITCEMLEQKGIIEHSKRGKARPRGYVCLYCGSGTKKEKTGVLNFSETLPLRFKCLACGKTGNVLTLLSKVWSIPRKGKEFFDLLKKTADEFGIHYDPKIFDNRAGYVKRNNSVAIHDGSGKSTEEIIAQIRDRCEWRAVKVSDGDGKTQFKKISIKPTQANLNLIFGNDPNLRGLVGHDQFCGVDVFLKRAPWHDKDEDRTGEQWNDTDNAQLRVYLRNVYADLEHEKKISDTRIDFARKNSFNAVKQFLSSLPKWDGEKRAETVFVKFLHAEDSEYTRVVTLNFLLGSIARVYYPGVEFANCPVLQGAQRIGKSRLIRMLGGKEGVNPNGQNWHVALKDSVDDSHATDALMKGWIIEIEEFSAARKAEVNNLKTFISATEDTRRFSYDKYATTRQRKNSFVVTCNDSQIFRDKTGNARFIVVKCSQKKFDRVPGMTPEYIRQVWAEALHIYNEQFNGLSKEEAGAKLLLPLKIQEQAEAIAEKYTQDDGMTLEITSYLDRKIPLQAIWLLLTKERRRKFIADGKIEVDQAELNFARRAQGGRNAQEDIDKIDSYLRQGKGVLKQTFTVAGGGTQEKFILFGTEYRQHICAAEIFQECFGQDKRKSMTRINEILTMLDGWTEGRRLQKADPEYNDQKHPYYRDEDNLPVEETEESKVTDFVGTPFDLEAPPF
ncbi:MAG: hypothetical protein IJ774_07520 [Selenomonadaceae bacterium]|nr:hypothetical protein [Selenomonadaceae bacterium]